MEVAVNYVSTNQDHSTVNAEKGTSKRKIKKDAKVRFTNVVQLTY